jgi:hypothetical protein
MLVLYSAYAPLDSVPCGVRSDGPERFLDLACLPLLDPVQAWGPRTGRRRAVWAWRPWV